MAFCTNYVDDLQSQSPQYKMYLYFVFLVREVMGCWEYVFVVEGYFENSYICGMFWLDLFLTNFGLQCGMGNHISWWQSNLIYSNNCFQLGTTVIIYRMLRLKVAGTRVACINKIVNINGH